MLSSLLMVQDVVDASCRSGRAPHIVACLQYPGGTTVCGLQGVAGRQARCPGVCPPPPCAIITAAAVLPPPAAETVQTANHILTQLGKTRCAGMACPRRELGSMQPA